MNTIYKYPLALAGHQALNLPANARILDVQMQGAELMLWALIDTDAQRTERRSISMYVTGAEFDQSITRSRHLATIQNNGIVIHVFDTTIQF